MKITFFRRERRKKNEEEKQRRKIESDLKATQVLSFSSLQRSDWWSWLSIMIINQGSFKNSNKQPQNIVKANQWKIEFVFC